MIKLKNLIEGVISEEDTQIEFKRGVALAKKDYMAKSHRDLDPAYYPDSLIKGYNLGWKAAKKARGDTWWNRFNQKLTDWLGGMGSSRLR